jgi:hypothetical protein
MGRIEKTVFVSYRRTDESWGLAIFQDLTQHGYDVFIDYDGIASGNFETAILENIKARAHFLVLLTPTSLDRCGDQKDWMRREIEAALDSQRNIVPLMLAGFDFGKPAIAGQLTGKLAALKKYNGLEIPKAKFFSSEMERLRSKFLNVEVDAILRPASDSAQRIAKEQKDKAAIALGSEPRKQAESQELSAETIALGSEPRKQAESQELSAEIILLLDHLSGLPKRNPTSPLQVHLPSGCETYDDALARYFPIDEKIRRGETLVSPEIQFLLDLRDYLNSWAEPATGASIAFTTLVVRKSRKAEAERAYPEWIKPARALSRTMGAMLFLAVGIVITIAALFNFIYLGNSKIANIAEINAQLKSLDQEILREEREEAANRPAGTAVLPYCDDLPDPLHRPIVQEMPQNPGNSWQTVRRFRTVAQSHLCTELEDLHRKLELAYDRFPRDDGALPARLNAVIACVTVLMGLLGSMTYVLLRYLRSVSNRLLTTNDLREYIIRVVLGVAFGVAIGFFTSASGNVIGIPVLSVGAPALAFLAGYNVEAVVRMGRKNS